jgi:hypothetical protein
MSNTNTQTNTITISKFALSALIIGGAFFVAATGYYFTSTQQTSKGISAISETKTTVIYQEVNILVTEPAKVTPTTVETPKQDQQASVVTPVSTTPTQAVVQLAPVKNTDPVVVQVTEPAKDGVAPDMQVLPVDETQPITVCTNPFCGRGVSDEFYNSTKTTPTTYDHGTYESMGNAYAI